MLVLSLVLAISWYALIVLGVSALSTEQQLAGASLATADASGRAWGALGANLLVLGGVGGIITSWNSFVIGGSRAIFAMAQHDMLPAWLGRVHPKYRTPANAVLAIGALSVAAPLFGRSLLVWIVNSGSFAVVLAYMLVAVSFLQLRRKEPDMPRPFRLRYGLITGWLALLGSIGLLFLYLPGSPSALAWPIEWGIVIAWFALGLAIYWFQSANVP